MSVRGLLAVVASVVVVGGATGVATARTPPVPVPLQSVSGSVLPTAGLLALDTTRDAPGGAPPTPLAPGSPRYAYVVGPGPLLVSSLVAEVETWGASADGALTVTSSDAVKDRPAPNVTFSAGVDRVTTVVVPVGADHRIAVVDRGSSTVEVRVTVTAQTEAGRQRPGGFTQVPPVRLLTPDGTDATLVRGSRELQVTGRGPVPAKNVTAAALLITVVAPAGTGQVSAGNYYDNLPANQGAQLSYHSGVDSTGTVFARVNAAGTLSVKSTGSVFMRIDLVGYVAGTASTVPGSVVATAPQPVLDTRTATNVGGFATLPAGRTVRPVVPVTDATPDPIGGVLVAVTTSGATTAGTVAVHAPGALAVQASTGYHAGGADTDIVALPLTADRSFEVDNQGPGAVDVVVSVIAVTTEADIQVSRPPFVRQGAPSDIVVDDADHRIFVADTDTSTIDVYNPNDDLVTSIPNVTGVRGLSLHEGVLYVARSGDGVIGRIDPRTLVVQQPYATGLPGVSRLAWSGSTLWATDHQEDDSVENVLWSIAPSNQVHQFRIYGEEIAISPAAPGTLFASRDNAVSRIDISTGTPGPLQGLDLPAQGSQLALSPDGRLLYVAGGGFCVVRIRDGRVVATRTAYANTGDAIAASATEVVLGQSPIANQWTAAVTGPHLEGPVLYVGGLTEVSPPTRPHGVAIADGLAYVAIQVGTNGSLYRLTSYRLP